MMEKSFQKLGDLLSALITRKGWGRQWALQQLKKEWPGLVGENASKHSYPASVHGEKLFVDVDSPIWANQLNFSRKKILMTYNSYAPKEEINDIFFKIKA